MYYKDHARFSLPGFGPSPKVRAIGWLDAGYDFPRGDVGIVFVVKLVELLVNPLQLWIAAGRHPCGFCRLSGGPCSLRLNRASGLEVPMLGVSNLWLPADGFLFVAPSLILHYMDAHGYSPPDDFQAAVMACPPMQSAEYLKALSTNGPKELFPRA